MSYSIIKGIKIENGKVRIKGAPNNVCPRTYEWEDCPSLTKILIEQGKDALDMELKNALPIAIHGL